MVFLYKKNQFFIYAGFYIDVRENRYHIKQEELENTNFTNYITHTSHKTRNVNKISFQGAERNWGPFFYFTSYDLFLIISYAQV